MGFGGVGEGEGFEGVGKGWGVLAWVVVRDLGGEGDVQ